VEGLGMHFLMMEYHKANNHPAYELQRKNWRNMNGEDIELGNRALSHCSKSVRGQAEAKSLHRSYRLLGCMMDCTSNMKHEIARFRSMKTWTSNKKMKYAAGQPTVTAGVEWMINLVNEFNLETYLHYQINAANSKKRGRPPGAKNRAPGEGKVKPKISWTEYNVGSFAEEKGRREIKDVPCLIEFDWVEYARTNLESLLKRQWRFGKAFNVTQMEHYVDQKDFFLR
jgi:hypothetical protein